jgi:hypothetical protein
MGVRILDGEDGAVLYCSTTMWAFGPVFQDDKNHSAGELADEFVAWLNIDARKLTDKELADKYSEFLSLIELNDKPIEI